MSEGAPLLESVRRAWEHVFWADRLLLEALRAAGDGAREAVREHAHIVGVEEVWLARLQARVPRAAVWPDVGLDELPDLVARTHAAWGAYLGNLGAEDLGRRVAYENSAGKRFENTVADIVLHVALHGQYHRGKVNLLLRQGGHAPAPTDYIAFVRGAAAAVTEPPA